ncbi:Na-H exchanger [Tieghemostelium lacteum]|uniref:Sodium/hydrogen exchanger n=1 Tax=Tieghemostelium lacteum TaxID=361077 RepID=A0A152A9N2_TIELA|nr:Na-H exchanger [Tieghemostelium lacteum]|eukprot:KYR02930.1 Na-H exchanger [Tieghemostelium lacteum]
MSFKTRQKLTLIIIIITLLTISTVATSTTTDLQTPSTENQNENENSKTSTSIIIFIGIIIGAIILSNIHSELNKHYIPESVVVIVYGVIIGLITLPFRDTKYLEPILNYNPHLFFQFLLPIIIFETGVSLPKSDFFKNVGSILYMAIPGTLISFAGTSVVLWSFGQIGISPKLPWREVLILCAMGCATDPVATISIFKVLGVSPLLYIMVLGESILNDAISLILSESVLEYTLSQIWKPILYFLITFVCSTLIGVFVSLTLAVTLKYVHLHNHPICECIYVLVSAYLSHAIADSLHLSGILSCFFGGMVMAQYTYILLSEDSKEIIVKILRIYSFIAEIIVFVYIGITLPQLHWVLSPLLILWTIVFFVITRAIAIFPAFYLSNRLKWTKISTPIQIVLWFSGLRGALTYSESLEDILKFTPFYNQLQSTLIILVYVTIGLFGIGTYPLLKYLDIQTDIPNQDDSNINVPPKLYYTFLKKVDVYIKYNLGIKILISPSLINKSTTKNNENDVDIEDEKLSKDSIDMECFTSNISE